MKFSITYGDKTKTLDFGEDMPQDDSLEAFMNAPPAAQVERVGRWRYSIIVTHGITQVGPDGEPWHRYGRQRAERKARRELARYKARQERETWTIT